MGHLAYIQQMHLRSFKQMLNRWLDSICENSRKGECQDAKGRKASTERRKNGLTPRRDAHCCREILLPTFFASKFCLLSTCCLLQAPSQDWSLVKTLDASSKIGDVAFGGNFFAAGEEDSKGSKVRVYSVEDCGR